jgi:hypothetical protein
MREGARNSAIERVAQMGLMLASIAKKFLLGPNT